MGVGHQGVEGRQVAEHRIHVKRIGHVVPVVDHRRRIERGDPQPVHAEFSKVGQSAADADQVTYTVAVPVGETADVHLVEDGGPPPGRVGGTVEPHDEQERLVQISAVS
jgi:hypothetical protein